jgi:hypothetical protein
MPIVFTTGTREFAFSHSLGQKESLAVPAIEQKETHRSGFLMLVYSGYLRGFAPDPT